MTVLSFNFSKNYDNSTCILFSTCRVLFTAYGLRKSSYEQRGQFLSCYGLPPPTYHLHLAEMHRQDSLSPFAWLCYLRSVNSRLSGWLSRELYNFVFQLLDKRRNADRSTVTSVDRLFAYHGQLQFVSILGTSQTSLSRWNRVPCGAWCYDHQELWLFPTCHPK